MRPKIEISYNGPAITITSPSHASRYEAPAAFTVTAEVENTGSGTITKVEFYQDAAKIEEITSAPYTCTISNLERGTYSLYAKIYDSNGAVIPSNAVSVIVRNKGELEIEEEEKVKIQGGEKGFVDATKDETAKIYFHSTSQGVVHVKIYTLSGQLVWEAQKQSDDLASDYIEWACKNSNGSVVSSGVYVIHISGPGISEVKKIPVIR
ncbi:MAG: Ig-like domain-containing protein [bacterium]